MAGVYSKDNSSSSALTVTLALGASSSGKMRAFELATPPASPLDAHNELINSGVNPAVTVTTTTANCSIFSAICVYTDPGVAVDSGYTSTWTKGAGSNANHFGEYNLDVGAAGAQALTYGVGTSSGDQAIAAAAYKAAETSTQATHRGGIALSTISAINGITKSGISAINGLTI